MVDEVKSYFAATARCPLMVSPAPPHAVTAPVVVVEGTYAALGGIGVYNCVVSLTSLNV
jgi:hypothetical protein